MENDQLRFNFEDEEDSSLENDLEHVEDAEVVGSSAKPSYDETSERRFDDSYMNIKPEKQNSVAATVVKFVAAAATFGVIAGGCFYGINYAADQAFGTNVITPSQVETAAPTEAATTSLIKGVENEVEVTNLTSTSNLDLSSVVEATMKSTVSITGTIQATATDYGFYSFFGNGGYTFESPVSGSGVIIGMNDTELLIVTNAHVVDDVKDLKATLADGTEVSLVVKGAKSDNDIAVVAAKLSDLSPETLQNISVITVGDSSELKMGQMVIAIGNALGEGQSSTIGWVSALDRTITIENNEFEHLIMTDAAINPGNSGGALINAEGELVGITSSKYSDVDVEGMGYAIPISEVYDLINELMNRVIREKVDVNEIGYLGIAGMDISSSISYSYGIPVGILITTVSENSPAQEAGFLKNDVIVSFDGEDVSSFDQLRSLMEYYAAGETVTVEYYRLLDGEYELQSAEVTLANRSKATK
ncbi:MAG: trypsin-like peptidase domain-containing protein [Lachnospiraceae bacterium]|nr:trypsin-like peptidase domain-containing protein [Lachnospiraceae bacterium]